MTQIYNLIKHSFIYNKRICIHLLGWSYSTITTIIHLLHFWISKLKPENLSTLTIEENSGFETTQVHFRYCAFPHSTTWPLCIESEWLKEESSFTPLLNLLFPGQCLHWARSGGIEVGMGFVFLLYSQASLLLSSPPWLHFYSPYRPGDLLYISEKELWP